jgi:hypothetical protein
MSDIYTNMPNKTPQHEATNGGYILLMTVLIVSIILALSFGVYAITIKEIVLATYFRESTRAFAAADKGIECALYWDRGYDRTGGTSSLGGLNGKFSSIFASSTGYTPPSAGAACNGITLNNAGATGWSTAGSSASQGRTYFRLDYWGVDQTCVEVVVVKDDLSTTITANGYNFGNGALCASTDPRRVQRTIEVTTNI